MNELHKCRYTAPGNKYSYGGEWVCYEEENELGLFLECSLQYYSESIRVNICPFCEYESKQKIVIEISNE